MKERTQVRLLRYGAGILTLLMAIAGFKLAKEIPNMIKQTIPQFLLLLAMIVTSTICLCFSIVAISRCEIFLNNHYPKNKNETNQKTKTSN